jgi:hypothetical protein
MPSQPIEFVPSQASGYDELGGASPQALNVTVDGAGVVRRRPGIQAYADAPGSAIDALGLYSVYETSGGQLFVVGGGLLRDIYQVVGGVVYNRSALGVQLSGTLRPIVSETDAMVVYTDGGVPTRLLKSSPTAVVLGGSPPLGSHVAAMNARLLMNDTVNPSHIRASAPQLGTLDITGHETWSGLSAGLIQAEARPDPCVALFENAGELYAFGSRSLQSFVPDEATIFAAAVTLDTGVSSAYSIVKVDQSFAWLDQERRFVVGDARGVQVLSAPIQRDLHETATVSDCYGYRVALGHVDAFVWTLPTDGRTFVYGGGGWSQWCQHSGGQVTAFPVLSHFRRTGGGAENLVGLVSGRLCKLQLGVGDDLGVPITAAITTGFQDRGTLARKKTWRVRVCMRRGTASSSGTTAGLLQYRDDLGPWSDGIPIGVGSAGDSNPVVELFGLGWPYRKRQWRFEFSHSADFALASVVEDFEVCAT